MRKWIEQSPITIGIALVAVGLVVIFLGWNGAAGFDHPQGQIPYLISGGLTGIALVGAGLTVVVVQSARRDSSELAARLEELTESVRALGGATSGPTAVPEAGMVIAGRSTYHDPGCRLVRERDDLQPMSPAAAEGRDLAPCRICKPATAGEAAAGETA